MARTKNARNVVAVAIGHATRCPTCRSTRRTRYKNSTVEQCETVIGGEPVTHLVCRLTACKDCGLKRHDKVFECRAPKGKDG